MTIPYQVSRSFGHRQGEVVSRRHRQDFPSVLLSSSQLSGITGENFSRCWPVLRVFSFLAMGREKLPVMKVRFP